MKQFFFLIAFIAAFCSANAITVTHQAGWLETAYLIWSPVANTATYEVSYSGEGLINQKINQQLIRSYGSYFRADAVGLQAGSYTLKVVAIDSVGIRTDSTTTAAVNVLAHDRSGFGFSAQSPNGNSSGAYNNDGTLRTNAKVIYLAESNTTTVTLDVKTSASGTITQCTGIGTILKARQKGYDQTPLAIRIIGKISAQAMLASADALGSDNDLQIKGSGSYTLLNTTVEGIGNDATCFGWGILVRNCKNIEIRNLGFMEFPEDGVSLNTDNANIWVHHCDFFYGKRGSGDKEKGDGSLDSKESGWVTLAYNHFWDAGKCNLLGNGTENPEYLSYHHNWYDHSDSRHPRVRFHTVHVYNNYFDGNSKYGIGAANGCPDIFSENNYFHNCKYPMLISMQGSDIAGGSGTFSSENGGIIKSYNNHIDGATRYVPYSVNAVEFDAYEVTNRSTQIPNTVTSKQGGCTYSNFDTDPAIFGASVYPCTLDNTTNVPLKVQTYAGRIEGSDINFIFTDADNTNYDLMPALEALTRNYTNNLAYIQGIGSNNSGGGGDDDDDDDDDETAGEGGNLCDIMAAGSSSGFTITGSSSTTKGSVTVNGTTYSCCLKMESATDIAFTTTDTKTLTLIFLASETGKNVKIDNVTFTTDNSGKVITTLSAGTHSIKKGDIANLFYLSLAGTTSTNNVNAEKNIIKIDFYNIYGQKISEKPQNQIVIRETLFENGVRKVEKLLIME